MLCCKHVCDPNYRKTRWRQKKIKLKEFKRRTADTKEPKKRQFKDGASFCYCAYDLRIFGYSGFLRNLPTNTTIFLHGLWQCGKGRS